MPQYCQLIYELHLLRKGGAKEAIMTQQPSSLKRIPSLLVIGHICMEHHGFQSIFHKHCYVALFHISLCHARRQ